MYLVASVNLSSQCALHVQYLRTQHGTNNNVQNSKSVVGVQLIQLRLQMEVKVKYEIGIQIPPGGLKSTFVLVGRLSSLWRVYGVMCSTMTDCLHVSQRRCDWWDNEQNFSLLMNISHNVQLMLTHYISLKPCCGLFGYFSISYFKVIHTYILSYLNGIPLLGEHPKLLFDFDLLQRH